MRDHWRETAHNWDGRDRLVWHLTFAGCAELHALVGRLRPLLESDVLVPVEASWLHLTLHEVAKDGQLDAASLAALAGAARRACANAAPFRLRLGPPSAMKTAIVLPAAPAHSIEALRRRLHAVNVELCDGEAPSLPVGTPAAPHVSLAYAAAAADASPIVSRLASEPPLEVEVSRVSLLSLRRDYTWETIAKVPLRGA